MPFSSGRASALAFAAAMIAASCASAPPRTASKETFFIEGRLLVEGAHPFDRVILVEDEDGVRWPLEAGRLDYEMSLLEGHLVRVSCRRAGIHRGEGTIEAVEYTLGPVDGMTPVRGVLIRSAGSPALETPGGTLLLTGPLSVVVGEWDGHEAWVWGSGEPGPAGGVRRVIEVSGFEVLGRSGEE